MDVWVVTEGDTVGGVYSTPERAKAAVDFEPGDGWENSDDEGAGSVCGFYALQRRTLDET